MGASETGGSGAQSPSERQQISIGECGYETECVVSQCVDAA